MNENIDIVVTDKVAKTVVKNIDAIGDSAESSYKNVDKLQKALNALGGSGISKLQQQMNALTSQMSQQSSQISKLSQAQSNAEISTTKLATAQNRLVEAQNKAGKAMMDAEAATNRAIASQSKMTEAATKAELAQLRLAEAQRKAGAAADAHATGMSTLGKIVTAIAFGAVVRELVQMADAYSTLQSRLRLVTSSQSELDFTTKALFKTAQDARVSFTEMGNLYGKMATAAKDAGISQNQLLQVTKTISQAMTISGGSASSMNAALIQLTQGLASGTLRGEELNSVMEQTPRLAQAIAQGMGVSIGKLRELGKEGQLTSEAVLNALTKVAPQIEKEFGQMVPTISSAFTVLNNSLTNTVGEMDKATGASKTIAEAIIGISKAIDMLGTAAASYPVLTQIIGGAAGAAAMGLSLIAVAAGIKAITVALAPLGLLLSGPVGILLGLTVAAGAAAAAVSAYTSRLDVVNEKLMTQKKVIEENLRTRVMDDDQRKANMATLNEINIALSKNNVEIQKNSGHYANSNLRLMEHKEAANADAVATNGLAQGQKVYDDAVRKGMGLADDYNKRIIEMIQLKQAGKLTDAQYNEMLKIMQTEMLKSTGATKEHNKALAENASIYKTLSNLADDQIAKMQDQFEHAQKLTDGEKAFDKINQELEQHIGKLTKTQIKKIEADLKEIDALNKKRKLYDQLLKAVDEQEAAMQELNKAIADQEKAQNDSLAALTKTKEGIEDQNKLLVAESGLYAASDRDRKILIGTMQIELKLRRDIDEVNRTLGRDQGWRDAAIASLEYNATLEKQGLILRANMEQTNSILNSIEQTAHTVWTNIFDGGSNIFKKLGQILKASLLDMLYQLTIKKWVINISSSILGSIGDFFGIPGLGQLAGSATGANNLFGNASNVNTAANAYGGISQYLSGSAAGSSTVGMGAANLVGLGGGDSLGTLIAANGGWAGVGVGGATLGAGLGAGIGGATGGAAIGTAGAIGTSAGTIGGSLAGGAIGTSSVLGTGAGTVAGTIGTGATASGAAGGGAAAGSSLGFASIPVVGWIAAGMLAANALYDQGYKGEKYDDPLKPGGLEPTLMANDILTGIGLDSKFANIISGAPLTIAAMSMLGLIGGGPKQTSVASNDGNTDWWNPLDKAFLTNTDSATGAKYGGDKGIDSAALNIIKMATDGLESTAKLLGGTGKGSVWQAFLSTDPEGSANTMLNLAGGLPGAGYSRGDVYGGIENVGRSQGDIQAAVSKTIDQAVYSALQGSDIQQQFKDYLKGLDIKSDTFQEEFAAKLKNIGIVQELSKSYGDLDNSFVRLLKSSVSGSLKLIETAGGLDKLSAAQATYYQNFFTEAELMKMQTGAMAASFKDLGLTMPDLSQSSDKVKEQFRAMVEAQDLNTDAGQKTYLALLNLSGAFAQLIPAAQEAGVATNGLTNQILDVNAKLAELAGGYDNLKNMQDSYHANYFTQAEQLAMQTEAVSAQFAALGLTMPDVSLGSEGMKAAFRALVESQDLTTDAGRKTYIGLLNVQGSLSGLAGAAAQAASGIAAAQAAIANERASLQMQLWQAQGNEGAIRQDQLSKLDESNRGLQQQIYDTIDAQKAQQAAQAAAAAQQQAIAQAAQQAASEMASFRQAMTAMVDSLTKQINQLRGLAGVEASDPTGARQFIANAVTANGIPDANALNAAAEALKSFIDTADYATEQERDTQRLILANQLETIRNRAAGYDPYGTGGVGLPSFAVGTSHVPYDMVAQIHEGEEIVPAAYNTGTNEDLLKEMQIMNQRLEKIEEYNKDTRDTNKLISDDVGAVIHGDLTVNTKESV